MKRIYNRPQAHTVLLAGRTHQLTGSYKVNEYSKGSDITVGDEDE